MCKEYGLNALTEGNTARVKVITKAREKILNQTTPSLAMCGTYSVVVLIVQCWVWLRAYMHEVKCHIKVENPNLRQHSRHSHSIKHCRVSSMRAAYFVLWVISFILWLWYASHARHMVGNITTFILGKLTFANIFVRISFSTTYVYILILVFQIIDGL